MREPGINNKHNGSVRVPDIPAFLGSSYGVDGGGTVVAHNATSSA